MLPELTSDDLISIGVTSVGHRRKLLAAIASLSAAPPAATVTAAPRDASGPADAERRQLTVMFCDLVGSTELSSRLDPEDLREIIAGYHRAVAGIVAGFDGFVAKYMGDGVLVYFGYPRAHEDDAERAVRAGLGVIDAVGRLDVKSVTLEARAGIATGLVVVDIAPLRRPVQRLGTAPQLRYGRAICGRVRPTSSVSEIKLVFSIPPHRRTPTIWTKWRHPDLNVPD